MNEYLRSLQQLVETAHRGERWSTALATSSVAGLAGLVTTGNLEWMAMIAAGIVGAIANGYFAWQFNRRKSAAEWAIWKAKQIKQLHDSGIEVPKILTTPDPERI